MIWTSLGEFWLMGGYGTFVWGSVGVSVTLLSLEVALVRSGHQQALAAVCSAMDSNEVPTNHQPTAQWVNDLYNVQSPSNAAVDASTHMNSGAL